VNTFKLYGRTFREEAGDDGGEAGGGSADTGDETVTNPFSSLPDTWRTDLVTAAGIEGDDATALTNQLERVTDLGGLLGNYKSMQEKIRSGEISSGLPENPTEEQLTAWREANNVPLEATGYSLEGIEFSDDQKEIFSAVMEASHGQNISQDALQAQISTFMSAQEKIVERQQQQDSIDAQQAAATLKEAWGGDYQTNINMVDALLARLPEDARESLKGARLADGRGVMNSPELLEFFAQQAREIMPGATVVPGAENQVTAIADEIKQIQQTMVDDPDKYWKDPAMQDRLEKLLEAQERMG
jgi:hypothetical protein